MKIKDYPEKYQKSLRIHQRSLLIQYAILISLFSMWIAEIVGYHQGCLTLLVICSLSFMNLIAIIFHIVGTIGLYKGYKQLKHVFDSLMCDPNMN